MAAAARAWGLVLDRPTHEVSPHGEPVRLTRQEFDILGFLAQNVGQLVTHREILSQIWGPGRADDIRYLAPSSAASAPS